MEYKMNEGRNSKYFYQFSKRSTGEVILEGEVYGGNKQDCINSAWNHMRQANAGGKFYDAVKSTKSYEDIKLYCKRIEQATEPPIKNVMSKHGYSIKKLSERFGIPYRTVQNWAGGQRECPSYIVAMIDEILG